ncbi:MAG: helix-turn-helix transcriptional regulator [Deltaproteobacteria bacterium]|nr:helix-turn-helix transcriptional regulator [Deltaproteobacteria bacterium]
MLASGIASTRPTALGVRLKERRRLLGLTLAEVGERLGLANGNFIGMVERGERLPSDDRLLALAETLDLPERDLLTLKYEATARSQVGRLLAPPAPAFPRLRRFLLGTCRQRAGVKAEFEGAPRGTLESAAWRAFVDHVLVPALDADRLAPRRLREHVDAWLRRRLRRPDVDLDPLWFEEHADLFVPYARGLLHGWRWDPGTLSLHFELATPPRETIQVRLLVSPAPGGEASALGDLARLLESQGLADDDVDEIVTLVEFKQRRAARRRRAEEEKVPPS